MKAKVVFTAEAEVDDKKDAEVFIFHALSTLSDETIHSVLDSVPEFAEKSIMVGTNFHRTLWSDRQFIGNFDVEIRK